MALAPLTPRDRLQRVVDLVGRTVGYWWLIGAFGAIGGALALVFVFTRPPRYESTAVLNYHEHIQSSILSNNEDDVQRNLGDRFRELLLARVQLAKIIADPKLDPFPKLAPELAIDKLHQAVKFESRGGNNFRITYADSNADRAMGVTAQLAALLQEKDKELRSSTAQSTVNFIMKQKEEASAELQKREQALAGFLAKHPEFAQDPATTNGEGASIRAIKNASPKAPTGNPRLYALERQRERLQARLEASPDAPPVRVPAPPSPERIAAEAAVTDAQRELSSAKRELEDASAKYTDKHPTVIAALERVKAAEQRVARALAAVPPDEFEPTVAPATPADRQKLQKDLDGIDAEITAEEHAADKGSAAAAPPTAANTNWIVDLETQHADLRRQLSEQSERVAALASSAFRAELDASQKDAELDKDSEPLTIIDPAFKPLKPSGPGKTIFFMAGILLFTGLGAALALGLAIIDDRLYRRDDLDLLGVPVLAVVPPMAIAKRRGSRK